APALSDADPAAVIGACLASLAANTAPGEVMAQLRAVEGALTDQPLLRARWLLARATATNRLGIATDALGDLFEARRLLERDGDHQGRAEIYQGIAVVQAWRGDGREAALALLTAIAESAAAGDRIGIALALIEAGRLQMEIGRPGES